MRRQGRILVGIRLGDPRRGRQFPLKRSACCEQLAGQGADGGLGQAFWRDDQVIDADGLDLVGRSCRQRAEGAAGNLFRLIARMPLGNGLRDIDREEFRFAPEFRRQRDRLGGDLAVERPHRHECVECRVADHIHDMRDIVTADRDLVGIDAGFGKDDAKQRDVGEAAADDPDAAAGEIADLLDLRCGLLFDPLHLCRGRGPQYHDILAQDRDRLGIGRHLQIATRHGEIGFARLKHRNAFGRSAGFADREPNRIAIAIERPRQRLDQLLIVAAFRSDCDPQDVRPQREIRRAGGRGEDQQAREQNQQR